MSSGIHLLPREVTNDPVDILCCRHEQIHCFHAGLRLTVCRDLVDSYKGFARQTRGWSSYTQSGILVTFSARTSYCLSVAPRSFCECSSTTRIFHRPGFTPRILSRKPLRWPLVPVLVDDRVLAYVCERRRSARSSGPSSGPLSLATLQSSSDHSPGQSNP